MSISFKDYLCKLSEGCDDIENLNDDCEESGCDDEVTESAQVQLDLLKQIQPLLAKAPLSTLKQVLKRLESNIDES